MLFFFLIIRRPPRSTRTDTLFPSTTLFRSIIALEALLYIADLASQFGHPTAHPPIGGEHNPACSSKPAQRRSDGVPGKPGRSEEHTSELQSLMRISYAVFCLKKKKNTNKIKTLYT